MEFDQLLRGFIFIVIGVIALVAYFWGTNFALDRLIPDRIGADGDPVESRERTREAIRPWLFVLPAIVILTFYLVYPAIQTFYFSFGDRNGNVNITQPIYPETVTRAGINLNANLNTDRIMRLRDELLDEFPQMADITEDQITGRTNGDGINFLFSAAGIELERRFVLLRNYEWAFNPDNNEFWTSVRNNILWLFVPFMSTIFGLLIAVLADNVRWGTIVKSLIFMPMAISFVGASVIWGFVYNYRGPTPDQIGLLNAIVVSLGGEPQPWITLRPWNNFFLMIILIWIQTGFAMVLLSAALRGVPEETIEAARIDGASEIQIFFRVIIPQIMSTILVVLTTITIVVLKVFDIVIAMTNGALGTQVLANLMFDQSFRAFDVGRGAIVSVILMVAVVPILVWNIRQFQTQEDVR